MSLELNVNGITHNLDISPDIPLLFVLRNHLGLTAAKLGCGLEQCGACAVIVDGESRLTCAEPAGSFQGKVIETAEALSEAPRTEALRAALSRHAAAQCGYCLPGIFVALSALFAREAAPDDTQIRTALSPHLCRCGAHARVLRAAAELAAGPVQEPQHDHR